MPNSALAARPASNPPIPCDQVATSTAPVAVVAWPGEAARRGILAAAGEPRLLLVPPHEPPPVCWDDLEDWARSNADPDEIRARAEHLVRRARSVAAAPVLDRDGICRVGDAWAVIPPIEARILSLLLERPGEVVAREALVEAGWPDGTSDERILDSRIKLLRRRIRPLGMEIHTVRNVGLLVHIA